MKRSILVVLIIVALVGMLVGVLRCTGELDALSGELP